MKNDDISRKREENDRRNKNPEGDKSLPGDYPPGEDIMNRLNRVDRVEIDPDQISKTQGPGSIREELEVQFPESNEARAKSSGPSDLTKEDLEALGPRDLSMDGGDDEQLKHRVWPVDFAARDIDVPGSELDDRNEMVGPEDEENNSYSLGGDSKENLEDDPTRTLG
jgi:hypothetical protein